MLSNVDSSSSGTEQGGAESLPVAATSCPTASTAAPPTVSPARFPPEIEDYLAALGREIAMIQRKYAFLLIAVRS
jgi:hypothetical protein